MRFLLTLLLFSTTLLTSTADIYHNPYVITVTPDGSIHDALRQARELRRSNDPRCVRGIKIMVKAGRYYMQEPLFLRPEDSGWEHSTLEIEGEEGTVICGDPRQQHTQLWPKEGMERMIDFNTTDRTITIPTPPKKVLAEIEKLRIKNSKFKIHNLEFYSSKLKIMIITRWITMRYLPRFYLLHNPPLSPRTVWNSTMLPSLT